MAGSTARPNIRIEIHNNLVEPMEVEEAEEEGEISDTNEAAAELAEESVKNQTVKQRIWPNTNGGFTTGINIFDKEEQSKLQERAKRFHLKPDEINNFTDEQLQALHDSLGINIVDEKDVRFEAVHVRGTDDMSTEDVLEYFGKYGPAAIEWIDDSSCNVLWNDRISAARALYFLSKPIKGMPIEGPCDPFAKELLTELVDDKENEGGRSILLKNKDRVVELRDDNDSLDQETVSISDIKIPIPPGFWRLGIECDKSKSILLRFAFKSDKKPHRAEKFSEYYKKYGNPNYGGLKGIITETHKKKFKGIFDRNKDISKEIEADVDPKNPWGALAMHWNEDFKYCEKVIADPPPIVNKNKSDIMSRLGFKRSLENPSEETEVAEKKTKMPRMRMYADEEEEKIKRKKQLQKLKLTATNKVAENNVDDLRNILRIQPRKTQKIEIKEDDNVLNVDLASRLKNRNRTASKPPRNDTAEEGPPVIKHIEHKSRLDHREYPKDRKRRSSYDRYEKKLYSDKYKTAPRPRRHHRPERQSPEESFDQHKPRSKIAVVIKTQKTPTVASAVWSRANSERQRLKTVSESKLRHRRSSSSESSESSSSSSSSSESDSSEESMDSIDEARVAYKKKQVKAEKMDDENVLDKLKNVRHSMYNKNSLRLEINNDYFIKK